MPISPKELMRKLSGTPAYVSADALQTNRISKEDMKMLMQYGLTGNQLSKLLSEQLVVNYDRQSLYRECDRASCHWLMGAAMELYADVSTNFNRLHNASIWVTSEDTKIENELNRLLEIIGAEEKIFDWAWSTATYGDLWAKLNIHPDLGVIAIDDNEHPIEVSRADHNGRLLGFFHTPLGYNVQDGGKLIPPWEYVHFRLLGTKRRRPMLNDPSYGEFRTASIMAPETRRASVQYGSSLMTQALPNYKRLRMSEDCLLMARASKGVLRYLYKLKVDGCFESNTKIRLLDGTKPTIKEMADNKDQYVGKSVWTINAQNQLEPAKIVDVFLTKYVTQLTNVHLDNGEIIKCTPDHRFMLRDGSYKEAQYLQPNESLMPLYTKMPDKGLTRYEMVYNPGINKWHYSHRCVAKTLGFNNGAGYCTHHKDFNPLNNDPLNLENMLTRDHRHYHFTCGRLWGGSYLRGKKQRIDWVKKRVESRKSKGYRHSEITANKIGNKIRKAHMRGCYADTHKPLTEETKRKISIGIHAAIADGRIDCGNRRGLIVVPRETRICACGCGIEFTVLKTDPKTFMLGHNARLMSRGAKGYLVGGKVLNHKVLKVETITLANPTPVYDISVDKNHNFPLDAGVFVHNSNSDAILEMIDEISSTLKRARSLDTSSTSTKYDDKSNEFAAMEDIVMPVWGDAKNDLVVEKLGGEPDIHWITDVEALTNQTASALRTPLQLLGGYMKDMPSGLNTSAIENVDIRFARSCRRVQRSIITAVTRICQVHLALRGMIPDAKMFEVHMAETSTAEEKELMESLDKGVDVAGKVIEMFDNVAGLGREEKIDLLNYLNTKILKLDDLDISALCKKVATAPENKVNDVIHKELKDRKNRIHKESKKAPLSTEYFAHLPVKSDMLVESNNGKKTYKIRNAQWESCYGNCKVEVKTVDDKYVDTDGKTHDIKRQVESLVGVNS